MSSVIAVNNFYIAIVLIIIISTLPQKTEAKPFFVVVGNQNASTLCDALKFQGQSDGPMFHPTFFP